MVRIGHNKPRRKFVSNDPKLMIARACQTALENLEDRRLLSSTVFQQDAGNTYIAVEAENGYLYAKADGSGAIAKWNVVASPAADGSATVASGGAAIQISKPAGNNGGTGASAVYHLHFNTPAGTPYRLYVRDKFGAIDGSANDNSMFAPLNGKAVNTLPVSGQAAFDNNTNGADGRTPGNWTWVLSTSNTVLTAPNGDTTITFGQRENGYFFDRFVLSTSTGLTAGQLDAIVSTPMTLGTPVVTGAATGNSIALNWNAVPGATAYDVKRATTSGGSYTNVATGVTALNFTDNVPGAGDYFYVVTATATAAGATHGDSAEAKVTSKGAGALAAPVVTTTSSATGVSVNWFKPFTNVVAPTDVITEVTGTDDGDGTLQPSPAAEVVSHMFDGDTAKYLNFNDLNSGASVTPSFNGGNGSIITAIRLYTANDTPARDPASVFIEGSNDGGLNWAPIFGDALGGGTLNLPTGRNASGHTPNPLIDFNQLVTFTNTTSYKSYRVTFPTLRDSGSTNSMQIGEVELLVPNADLTGATGYNLKRGTSPTGPFATILSNTTAPGFFDNTAAPGTTYYYVVSSLGAGPEGPDSAPVAGNRTVSESGDGFTAYYYTNTTLAGTPGFQDIDPTIDFSGGNDGLHVPRTPPSFNTQNGAGAQGDNFSIRWEGMVQAQYNEPYTFYTSTDDGARLTIDGVQQYDFLTAGRGEVEDKVVVRDADGNPVTWAAGSKHDVLLEYQEGGGGYGYHLRWSSPSTPKATVPQSQVQALAPASAPTGLAGSSGNQTVILNWNTIAADNYTVLRADALGGPYAPIAVNVANPTYTDTGLTNGHTYFYEVLGNTQLGSGPASAAISVKPAIVPPGQTTGVTASTTASSVTLNWTATPFSDSYNILRQGPGDASFLTIKTGVTGTTFTDSNVTLGNIYAYEVVPVNVAGAGTASAPINGDLQNGVTIHYYNNQWWRSQNQNTTGYLTPSLTNVNAVAVFPTGHNVYGTDASPVPGIQNDNWSSIITGSIVLTQADVTQADGVTPDPIVFVSNTDDDGYLFIDGQLVASEPGGHGQDDAFLGAVAGSNPFNHGTPIPLTLTAGTHTFVQFQSEGGGGAGSYIKWIPHYVSGSLAYVDIPASRLRTTSGLPTAPSDLAGSGSPGSGVSLTWADHSNELAFTIQRSTTPTFDPGTVFTVGTAGLNDQFANPNVSFNGDLGNSFTQDTYYRVLATTFEGNSLSSNVLKIAANFSDSPGSSGHFYNNQWWRATDQSNTAPFTTGILPVADVVTVVSSIDGDNATNPTALPTGINASPFSDVFTGKLKITAEGDYTFPIESDDDSYLFLDGNLVADNRGGHGNQPPPADKVTKVHLTPGAYNYQFFHSQGVGGWSFHFKYTGPDADALGGNPGDPQLVPFSALSSIFGDPIVAPGALTFPIVSSGSVTLNWTDTNKDELRYVVERSTDNFATVITQLGSVGINATSYTDSTVLPDKTYQYRVRGENFDFIGANTTGSTHTLPPGTGGSITASQGSISPYINLTALGTRDWAHWGLNDGSSYDHKAGATDHISNLSTVGGAAKNRLVTSPVAFSWTDGTPTGSFLNTTTTIFNTAGVGTGYEFSAPADLTTRRIMIYVGVANATGVLTAHLSDGSSAPFTSAPLDGIGATPVSGVYTVEYKASLPGQTIIFDWTETADHGSGAIAIGAAALESTTDFVASATASVNSVALSWAGPVASTTYNVLRSSDGGTTFTPLASNVTGSGYVDNTALLGNVYQYKIVANNGGPTTAPVTADLKNGVSIRYYNNQWWNAPSVLQNTNGYTQASLTNINGTSIYPSANQIYGNDAPPVVGIQADNWSDVITGSFTVSASDVNNIDGVTKDPIVFVNATDDDGYLFIDGQLVASDPGGHGIDNAFLGATQNPFNPGTAVPLNLAPGVHTFIQFHSEGGGGAGAQIKWIRHYNTPQAPANPEVMPTGIFTTQIGAPSAPTTLAATVNADPNIPPATPTTVTLTWTDTASREINYVLQRSTSPTFAPGTITTFTLPLHDNAAGTTVSFTDPSNVGLQKVYYRVFAANFEGNSGFSNTIPVEAFAAGEQHGAEAHFYNDTWWKSGFAANDLQGGTTGTTVRGASATPDSSIIVQNIAGHGNASPTPGINGSSMSVVFTGKVLITQGGPYLFPTESDDDSYLYVDGVLVAADPKPHGREVAPILNTINLTPGAHDFQFFVSQQFGDWDWHLNYIGPDNGGNTGVAGEGTVIDQSALTSVSSAVVAPGPITFSNMTNNSVQITWGDTNVSEIQYVVERSSDNFVNDVKVIGTTGINGTSMVDNNLPAGNFTYRVHAVNFDSQGAYATAVLDHQPPTVTASAYHFDAHPSTFTITFSEDVSASLASNPIIVANLTTPGSVPYTGSYNAATNTYTMTFAATLPDANYRVTMPATVKDATGNSLTTTTADFFVLKGDVNRDRSVVSLI